MNAAIRRLVERTATEHFVRPEDILGRSRFRNSVAARHRTWRILRDTLALSYPEIGRMFGVDHTTVLEACEGRRAKKRARS